METMEWTLEYNNFLPKKILTIIFSFLDRKTLVYNCRSVCKFWKEVVECADVWKTVISREAKVFCVEQENILRTAHLNYPWYICYVLGKNIFYRNLFPDWYSKGTENMTYWTDVFSDSVGVICPAPLDSHLQGFGVMPQEIQSVPVRTCFLASLGDCALNETIDLYLCGFTRKIFECVPPIHFSEWVVAGYHFTGTFVYEISFFNSHWKRDSEYGIFRSRGELRNREWHKVSHTFMNYRPDVRYITLTRAIETCLDNSVERCRETASFDNAAAKIAGAKLVITMPELSESSDT